MTSEAREGGVALSNMTKVMFAEMAARISARSATWAADTLWDKRPGANEQLVWQKTVDRYLLDMHDLLSFLGPPPPRQEPQRAEAGERAADAE